MRAYVYRLGAHDTPVIPGLGITSEHQTRRRLEYDIKALARRVPGTPCVAFCFFDWNNRYRGADFTIRVCA